MMNFSSIIAISRESNNAIITKYIPIALAEQFNLKILLGLIVNTLSSFWVAIFHYLCTKNILVTITIFFELILINLIGEKIKLLIDLKRPQLNWNTEYTMMKQNTNVMYELFYTFLISLILFVISKIFTISILFLAIIIITLIITNTLISRYIRKKEYLIFGKIY